MEKKHREEKFSEMNKEEFVKISIDVRQTKKERVVDFLKRLTRRIENSPHFDTHDFNFDEGGSVVYASLFIENKGLGDKTIPLCRACNKPMDEHAIISTGLCTPCFTSNA